MTLDVAPMPFTVALAADPLPGPAAPSAPLRVQRPGYWHETRLAPDGKKERAVYSALPGIVVTNAICQSVHGPVVTVDPLMHLSVNADVVYVLGPLTLTGRNVKIVARKLLFIENEQLPAGIKTDGVAGEEPLATDANPRPSKPARADAGHVEATGLFTRQPIHGKPGTDGGTASATAAADGSGGQRGTPAGTIDICVDSIVGTGHLSACGGDGHAGQDGQGGQDGGDGGHGAVRHDNTPPLTPNAPSVGVITVANPGAGGHGADAGRGGPGGSGGDAGLIRIRSAKPIPSTVTVESKLGKAGQHGADGAPGTGGWAGRPYDMTSERDVGTPVEIELVGVTGALSDGAVIGLKTREEGIDERNTLGAFGGEKDCYYYYGDDAHEADRQAWKIELVQERADATLRYGDRVTLTNISWSNQQLALNGEYLTTIEGCKEAWRLVSPPGHVDGDPLRGGSRVYLEAKNGQRVTLAYSGTARWFPRVGSPRVLQAAAGKVRDKPAGRDPWAERTDGKASKPELSSTVPRAELSKEWTPIQAWLQIERLNALLLTIELSGTQDTAFYDEISDWMEIFGGREDPAFASVKTRINRMAGNLDLGFDPFGNPRDFAPNLSFAYYDEALTVAIQSFRDFETRRAALLSAVQAAESTQQDAAIAFNEASVRRELAREQVGSAVTALRSAARTLEETSEQFNALKAPLDPSKPHVAAFTTEIKEKFNACDMKAILESIGMMAFCPPVGGGHEGAEGGGATMSGSGVLMAGAQFAAYLQHGVSTIKNAYGVTVDKNDVLQQVNGVNGVGKKLFASAQSIYNDARGFKSDIGSSAILATLDQWEDLVSEFVILESAQPLLADIHALMNATRARGSALISYNVALGDVIDLSATLADTTRVIDESLARVADGNAPELNDQLTFLARQYQEQKDDVIELVYLANRAYAYWRLDDWAPGPTPDGMGHTRNVFRSVMAAGSEGVYAAIDATVLESCHSKLDSWFHHDLSSTPGAPTPMPSLKRTNGFQIFVRDKKLMTELREKRRLFEREVHYVHIDISADGAGGSFTDEHLARLYDYRLTTFRVFLHGAHRETSADHDKLIHMEFIHDSREYNYTATGQRRTYSRPELDVRPFIYDGSRGALRYLKDEPECFAAGFIHTDGDIGCGALDDFAGSGKYPVYAGISPFSQWTIILDPNANKGITFDDELSLEIQLLGSARERR